MTESRAEPFPERPDCVRCQLPADIEIEGTPMCRECYGRIVSP